MADSGSAPTVFTSSTVTHPVDRSGLRALEDRVGEENAFASCLIGEGALAVFADSGNGTADERVVIQRAVGTGWDEVGRYEYWADAYRVLGVLLDESLDQVPVDPIDRPSPTILIPAADGCVQVMYLTAEGVRVARELSEGFDPRFEVYDVLWGDFTTATDDEASLGEMLD